MTNLWFCVVSACFWVLLAGFTGKFKRDYLHPVVMFSILFSISYPLKLIMSFYGFHTLDSMSVDDEVILLSIFVFNLAGIAFVVPLLVGKPIITDSNIFRIKAFPIYMTALLIVLFLIISYGSEALGAIFSTDGLRARIDERGGERVGSGLSALFRQAGSFLIIIFAMQFIHTKNKKIVLFFVFILFYSWLALSLSGSKYEAFYMVVVSFITYYYYKRAKGIEILNFTRMILGFTGALIFVGLIGYARGYGAWEGESKHPFLLQTLYQLINAFDAPDNLIVLLDRGESWLTGSIGMTLARDYLILPFIPRAIWSGKPLVQGNQLVMESYFPERFSGYTGEVISPSFPGEMILTGGIIYMVIWSLFLGFMYKWLYQKSQKQGGIFFVAYIWCCLNIFNFLRSGTGVVGALVTFMIVVIFLQYIIKMLYFIVNNDQRMKHEP